MSEGEDRPPYPNGAGDDVVAAGSEPSGAAKEPDPFGRDGSGPSLVPGMALLILAGALIVVVLVKPSMPGWLRATIAIAAVCVVLALLVYAFFVFRASTRRDGPR